jgi:hypothetical protein
MFGMPARRNVDRLKESVRLCRASTSKALMQEASATSLHPEKAGSPAWLGWMLVTAFVGVAAWLGTRPPALAIPLAPGASFDRAALTPRGLRAAMTDPPAAALDGKQQLCGECHLKDVAAPLPPSPSPHQVTLHHGMNDWCFNCHDVMDRERLVLQDTTTVSYGQVPVLCAQCHGTTYRDWQKGMHGKSMNSWDEKGTVQRRLLCTECHNPHGPAYGRLTPLPAPNTLRMGEQASEHEEGVEPSPLRHWRKPGSGVNHYGDHSR